MARCTCMLAGLQNIGWLIILFLQSQYAITQYVPFKHENASWSMLLREYEWGDSSIYFRVYDASGDTLLGGRDYFILKWRDHHPAKFFISDDTISGKVYMYEEQSGIHRLLYDYSLDVGDTAQSVELQFPSNLLAVVAAIDTINLGGIPRKVLSLRLSVSGPDTILRWIEGVGSSAGFGPLGDQYWYPDRRELVCYRENDSTVYYSDLEEWYDCDSLLIPYENPPSVIPNTVSSGTGIYLKSLQVQDNGYINITIHSNKHVPRCRLSCQDVVGRRLSDRIVSLAQGDNLFSKVICAPSGLSILSFTNDSLNETWKFFSK